MSSSSPVSDEKSEKVSPQSERKSKPAAGMKAGLTLIVVVIGTWIGVAGAGAAVYLLAKSGRIPVGALSVGGASGAEAKATRTITLEPILANLADAGGHAYVRLGLRVEVFGGGTAASEAADAGKADAGKGDAGKGDAGKAAAGGAGTSSSELESSIRDTVLAVLGRQTSADLLGPDGKEHLKIELKEAIERGGVRVDVKDLFFTDFLVQI